jgi:hypothetical protein
VHTTRSTLSENLFCTMVYMDYMDGCDVPVNEDFQSGQDFKHGFGLGFPMLLCCRQVYHESAGFLCGDETCAICRALHRHHTGRDDQRFDQDPTYHQFSYASE